jgi:hypothetical protein
MIESNTARIGKNDEGDSARTGNDGEQYCSDRRKVMRAIVPRKEKEGMHNIRTDNGIRGWPMHKRREH